ncbi:polysaccharide deacetylase family protein [Lentibacillus sp. N15]|uniref:polysaccharide deacetylase family protein n=1 Tax=Lentibacillus songyuanensis TaxID=3136161 RepID=UPI0031B9AEF4
MKKMILCCLMFVVTMTACSDPTAGEQPKNQETDSSKTVTTNKKQDDLDQHKEKKQNKEEEKDPSIEAKYKVSDAWSIVPIADDADEKVVLLTFDDAPDEYAMDIAKTLKKMNARAIFFVNGHFLDSPAKKKELKQIHDMGFMIGNHTDTHAYLPDLSKKEQKAEIVRVDKQVEDIIGEKPKFFRAPNGANTDYSKKVVKDEGMVLMNWSYGYDWNKEYMSKDAITDIMLHTELLTDGANLLMHDRKWTAAAIEDIVTGLRDKGYKMVDPKLIKTRS